MQKLGLIVNTQKPRAAAVLQRLITSAREVGFALLVANEAHALVPDLQDLADDNLLATADVVMALGGDGTMLAAVHRLVATGKPLPPLMGLNIGSLGFMTSVTESDMRAALQSIRDDQFLVSERSLLTCEVQRGDGSKGVPCQGLNDVVVRNGATSRVVMLEVSIDDSLVTTYVCDGVIVSTPTGSTGYSLSAGGPIVLPQTAVFVVSVICPHTLSSRPLVVPDRGIVRIKVCGQATGLHVSIDGQNEHQLKVGDMVQIRLADQRVQFLHLPTHDYFGVLRQKLGWSGSAVTQAK